LVQLTASTSLEESAGVGARVVAESAIVGVEPLPKYWLVIFFVQAMKPNTARAAAKKSLVIIFFIAAIIE
jgi:hypothetical protein